MRTGRSGENRLDENRPGERRPTSSAARLLFLAILVLAALLRFYRLDAQSFWNDEGNAARIAERSVDLIVEGAAGDVHPPGYYLLLHLWRAAFGKSELALRSLSVVAGLALVAGTYLLGRRLFNEAPGLVAAFLAAVSPFGIYYSQEARMYALLGAVSALSSLLLVRLYPLTDPPRLRRCRALVPWVAYVVAGAAGLYTHYAFVFVLVAHNVAFGVWWLVERLRVQLRWRALAAWAGAQTAMGLLYLPWLPIALDATGRSSAGGEVQLGGALLDVLRVLTVGITLPLREARAALVVAAALIVAGLIPGWGAARDRQRTESGLWPGVGLLLVTLLIPLVLFFGFDLYKPAWLKFLVVVLPPFYILLARGVVRLGDVISRGLGSLSREARPERLVLRFASYGTILLALTAFTYPSLRNLYFNPAYFRDDYRQIAADIRAVQRPGDAIVLNAPNQWEVFTYYAPDEDVYPAPYRPSSGKVERFLAPIREEHERIFVLYWGDAESDPRRRIESWLAEHAYKTGDRWYGDVRLAMYSVAPLPQQPQTTLTARFGGSAAGSAAGGRPGILLHGYALAADEPFAPGDVLPVTLFWEAEGAVAEPYKITLQMLDEAGRLSAQVDTVPRDGLAPTTSWEVGEVLTDRYGLHLSQDLSPGRYTLIVAIYHVASGERLDVAVEGETVGDHLALRQVTVGTR
jgi:4-amino-4-deoxy-L-arabinose transferase-like glycosyltransferase